MLKFSKIIMAALALITIAACHHDDTNNNNTANGSSYVKMKIDGTQWTANSSTAYLNNAQYVNVIGHVDSAHSLLIQVANVTAETDYDLLADSSSNFNLMNIGGTSYYIGKLWPGSSGTVHIDQIQSTTYAIKKVKGTFHGVAVPYGGGTPITITEGSFDDGL